MQFLPEFRGKGYAFEAASAVLDHGHRVFGLSASSQSSRPTTRLDPRAGKAGMKLERETGTRPGDPVKLFARDWA